MFKNNKLSLQGGIRQKLSEWTFDTWMTTHEKKTRDVK